jgi:hypothetical protein
VGCTLTPLSGSGAPSPNSLAGQQIFDGGIENCERDGADDADWESIGAEASQPCRVEVMSINTKVFVVEVATVMGMAARGGQQSGQIRAFQRNSHISGSVKLTQDSLPR